jgi:hypothetical protein
MRARGPSALDRPQLAGEHDGIVVLAETLIVVQEV